MPSVNKNFLGLWPLFLGLSLLMIGNGLQGTLLGVRASAEGFSTTTIGVIMSLFYGGFLLGCVLAPRLVRNVGHIRVFAALAALASSIILVHGIFVNPYSWALFRIITGFCFAGLYIVIESWFNDMATNKNRGKILSAYLLIFYVGMVAGQYTLVLASPEGIELFALTSVLISLALLPIALSRRPAPEFQSPHPISPRELLHISPLGIYGILASGLAIGTFLTIGPVFATQKGMSLGEIATFMAAFSMGGVAAQLPLGYLSDKIERRKLIILVTFLSALALLACQTVSGHLYLLYAGLFVAGMGCLSLYGLCAAHTNDQLSPGQYVGASATLILTNGLGSLIGPFTISLLMSKLGTGAFLPAMAVIYISIFLFAVYREIVRPALPLGKQSAYFGIPPRATPIAFRLARPSRRSRQ